MQHVARRLACVLILFVCGSTFRVSAQSVDEPRHQPHDRVTPLHLSFAGLICHIFDPSHPARAVMIRGTDDMPHAAVLRVPSSEIESSEVPLTCSDGTCALDLTNTALRFTDGGAQPVAEKGGTFDTIVPHLRAITGGEMSALRDDTFDEVPSPLSPVLAYLELPAGHLTTVPFEQLAAFVPDLEHRGARPFPNGVFLSGKLDDPVLLVRRTGDDRWSAITFRSGALIDLRLTNEPANGMPDSAHASLVYALSKYPLSVQPAVQLTIGRRIHTAPFGTIPGCSDTQYP